MNLPLRRGDCPSPSWQVSFQDVMKENVWLRFFQRSQGLSPHIPTAPRASLQLPMQVNARQSLTVTGISQSGLCPAVRPMTLYMVGIGSFINLMKLPNE